MKTIYKLARTELQVLFYSPVAWLILVIFTFQVGATFTSGFGGLVRLGNMPLISPTISVYTGWMGAFSKVLQYVYLYMPLLTMGIMSRELSSGSIKLLYSSPITNTQIILGKYLALMIFGLMMVGVLLIFAVFGMFTINHAEIPFLFTCILGIYLLICAYAAIGLFMSSLTSYNVVAAIGTLSILALLNYASSVGQDMNFVRDVTYWLAINGRADTFIRGMITSEDVLYFVIVPGMFLCFTIIRLHAARQKSPKIVTVGKYAGVFVATLLIGYLSTNPFLKVYYDSTYAKVNTLSKASQEVVNKLKGGFTIHTYTNMLDVNFMTALPFQRKGDEAVFEQYVRFKPEIKMDYTYYYHRADNPDLNNKFPNATDKQMLDTMRKNTPWRWNFDVVPYSEISKKVDLAPEKFGFVRVLERDNGQKTFLRIYDDTRRMPAESEITAAMKRLVMKLPVVGFVTGNGERDINALNDRGYRMIATEKSFRYSMVNQGFDCVAMSLDKPVDTGITMLVIAEPTMVLTAIQQANLDNYIASGRNLLIAGEPGRQDQMNAITRQIGVQFLPGRLATDNELLEADLMAPAPTPESAKIGYQLQEMIKKQYVMTMPNAAGLDYSAAKDKGFDVTTMFKTDSVGVWNEVETTDFIDHRPKLNPAAGEVEKSYPLMLALSRKINGKEQKIIVTGDADWISNSELSMRRITVSAANFYPIVTSFFWLSDGKVPIDIRHPDTIDTSLKIGKNGWAFFEVFLKWGLAGILVVAGVVIWVRRRGR